MKKFYEIKNNGTWTMVASTGMMAINTYCKDNGFSDWRAVGMMSISEQAEANQNCEMVG